MITFRKILVPVAFTDACQSATKYARVLSEQHHSELHILHVVEPAMSWLGNDSAIIFADLARLARSAAERKLRSFLARSVPDAAVQAHIAEGEAAHSIVKFAATEHMDMIVMPTRGPRALRRLVLGSVTGKVLHDSDLPVWTGTHVDFESHADPAAIKRIVCAVDIDTRSEPIAGAARAIADVCGASVYLLHVLPSGSDAGTRERCGSRIASKLTEIAEAAHLQSQMHVGFGKLPAEIVGFACSREADLVIIGRSRCHGNGRLPEHTYTIIRDSPCPVLSI